MWFYNWWHNFGRNFEIMPVNFQKDFKEFSKEETFKDYTEEQVLLHYYIKNRIPWIFCWNFNKNYSQGIYTFTRQFKVKWWDSVKEIKFPMEKNSTPKEAEKIHEFLTAKKSIPMSDGRKFKQSRFQENKFCHKLMAKKIQIQHKKMKMIAMVFTVQYNNYQQKQTRLS